jgi:hypothetical protein
MINVLILLALAVILAGIICGVGLLLKVILYWIMDHI